MKECSKSITRRLADCNFANHYFVGRGLDIGGKPDPLALYLHFFPKLEQVRTWDREDGDAQFLETEKDGSYDFVHSSHCLEHLVLPEEGLKNWIRVVREGGHLIITVPDEDLYEQGVFPSTYNADHKWTFTIYKQNSWSPRSINLLDLIRAMGDSVEILRIEKLYSLYRHDVPRFDQSIAPFTEAGIEVILRKRTQVEIADKGGWRRDDIQPEREVRIHLNQYRNDIASMKNANLSSTPFTDDSAL